MRLSIQAFDNLPVGTPVQFRGRHAHAGEKGVIASFQILPSLPHLGIVARVRLDSGTDCFALKPKDLRLAKRKRIKYKQTA